jgi:hypothetical protein
LHSQFRKSPEKIDFEKAKVLQEKIFKKCFCQSKIFLDICTRFWGGQSSQFLEMSRKKFFEVM